ncbi:hypothetical protein [Pseudomonas sp. DP16D-R1]|uniref:hypothetical protein n=1 Tax=Pseudomonas sp. DP16D-R1 TaxID=2075551 RepID=UPI0011AF5712|nr:hypothetical protein [Pseudomonas sp. DP16D-R1]
MTAYANTSMGVGRWLGAPVRFSTIRVARGRKNTTHSDAPEEDRYGCEQMMKIKALGSERLSLHRATSRAAYEALRPEEKISLMRNFETPPGIALQQQQRFQQPFHRRQQRQRRHQLPRAKRL